MFRQGLIDVQKQAVRHVGVEVTGEVLGLVDLKVVCCDQRPEDLANLCLATAHFASADDCGSDLLPRHKLKNLSSRGWFSGSG